MKRVWMIAAAFALIGAGAASAQERHDYISELDTDHDGRVARSEFGAMQNDHFNRQDANHDDRLSVEEARLGTPLTRAEYATQAFGTFDQADTNHDAFLDGDEVQALRNIVATGPRPAAPQ